MKPVKNTLVTKLIREVFPTMRGRKRLPGGREGVHAAVGAAGAPAHWRWIIAVFAVAWTGCVAVQSPTSPDKPERPERPDSFEPVTSDESDDAFEQIHLLTQAIIHIRRSYIDEEKTDYHELIQGAMRGMLNSLDPYSQFLDAESYRALRENAAGEFAGIGVTIGIRDNILTVIAPMEDTPAFRAGILAGDRIIQIDDNKTDGINLTEAVGKLRGQAGETVVLRIMRDTRRDLQTFELVRDIIRIESVRGSRMLNNAIGYIRIVQFTETTAESLLREIEQLIEDGMQALVLDLRNNSGGLLLSAIEVSRRFLPSGAPIVTTRGRGDVMVGTPVRSVGNDNHTGFPMAILVNGGTASAAEIVAGSLQDNRRAILVGESTFGKGSVQSILRLGNDAAIRLTTARYVTPSERVIHDKGIDPDIAVPMTAETWRRVQTQRLREENPEMARDIEQDEDVRDVTDVQLERATDLLKALLIFQDKR